MSSRGDGPTLAAKLGITGEVVFTTLHAPTGFVARLGDIGEAIEQRSLLAPIDVIVTFQRTATALAAEWPRLADAADPQGRIWVAFPAHPADGELDGDTVRRAAPSDWVNDKACTIDTSWQALRFAYRAPKLRPRDAARRRR